MRLPVFALALTLAGCGEQPLVAVTYNTGLAVGYVRGASTRAPETAAAVATLNADIVCLQEVWRPEDVALFQGTPALAAYESTFATPEQIDGGGAGCTQANVSTLLTCFTDSCGDVCIDDQATCLLSSCALPFAGLDPTCGGCVQANVGHTPQEVSDTCTTSNPRYAYDGALGLGVLSRFPILTSETHAFDSTTNRRAVMHVTVDAPRGPVDVYCTHLTADLSPIPYTGPDGSWGQENATQIAALLAYVTATAGDGVRLLMGDFNTGPSEPGMDGELPDNYDLFVADGLADPYTHQSGQCSFCPSENGLQDLGTDDRIIDHIFVANHNGARSARRVLDETVDVMNCADPLSGAHSDHFGVQVTLDP